VIVVLPVSVVLLIAISLQSVKLRARYLDGRLHLREVALPLFKVPLVLLRQLLQLSGALQHAERLLHLPPHGLLPLQHLLLAGQVRVAQLQLLASDPQLLFRDFGLQVDPFGGADDQPSRLL
jgi:hypothetical protein